MTELRAHSLDGVGPGRFEVVNPVSRDADLRRGHSTPLQQGAEQGAVGLVLVLCVPAWALGRLWLERYRDPAAVLFGAAVIIVVGLHFTFDWIAANPFVTFPAAALVGSAVRPRPRPGRRNQGWRRPPP